MLSLPSYFATSPRHGPAECAKRLNNNNNKNNDDNNNNKKKKKKDINDNDNNNNLREFAGLTAVILTPLRVEAGPAGPSVTSFWRARRASLAKGKSMVFLGDLV